MKRIVQMAITIIVMLIPDVFYGQNAIKSNDGGFNLEVTFKGAKPDDTLRIISASQYFKGETDIDYNEQYVKRAKDGLYHIKINSKKNHGYWYLLKKGHDQSQEWRVITPYFFWEAGDNIQLALSNVDHNAGIESYYNFKGKEANKYILRYKVDSVMRNSKGFAHIRDQYSKLTGNGTDFLKHLISVVDSLNLKTSLLAKNILISDIIYQGGFGIYTMVYSLVNSKKVTPGSLESDSLYLLLNRLIEGRGIVGMDNNAIAQSERGVEFICYAIQAQSLLKFGHIDADWLFEQMNTRYKGMLRDRLIAYLLIYARLDISGVDRIYKKAKAIIRDPDAKEALLKASHLFGKLPMPNYTLIGLDGSPMRLEKLRGKVVLIDFWFTGCGYCATYYKNVLSKAELSFASDKDVVFLSVCLDKDKNKWKESVQMGIYTSSFALNLYTNGLGWEHPMVRNSKVTVAPTVLLMNRKGEIVQFNTENLYSEDKLREAILTLK